MIFQENNLNNEDIQNFIDKPKSKMSLRASSLAEILRLEGSTSAEKVKTFVKDLTRDVPLRENDMKRLLNKFNFLFRPSPFNYLRFLSMPFNRQNVHVLR